MNISIIIFDNFTDIDLWLMWDLLKRVRFPNWHVQILGEKSSHISQTGIVIATHGSLQLANKSDVVLFVSGPGTRKEIHNKNFLGAFQLNPDKQLIGSMCSGALLLAALGILKAGDKGTTYPTAKKQLEEFQINVVEEPFVQIGNVATAAGCLAAQYLSGWVIEKGAGIEMRNIVLQSIQPVGEGLHFGSDDLNKLYSTSTGR